MIIQRVVDRNSLPVRAINQVSKSAVWVALCAADDGGSFLRDFQKIIKPIDHHRLRNAKGVFFRTGLA